MSNDNGDKNGRREQFLKEREDEETVARFRATVDLEARIRSGLELYADAKKVGEKEYLERAAGGLAAGLNEYLAHPSADAKSKEKYQVLLEELRPYLPQPATQPAQSPAPRPTVQAEQRRIVTPGPPEPQPPQPAEVICAGYILMPQTSTYALGVHALRQACEEQWPNIENADSRHIFVRPDGSRIYRPLTSRETIQARVNSYEQSTPEDRLKLFDKWEDSCTGAAYKARTTKFKLIPQCGQLITIPADFNEVFLNVPYNTWDVPELDSAAPRAKFNQQLTPNEVEENEGWRAAVENDLTLLRTYRDVVWDAYTQRYNQGNRPERLMGFYVRQNTSTDELRAWFVLDLLNSSYANSRSNLLNDGSFLRVAHR